MAGSGRASGDDSRPGVDRHRSGRVLVERDEVSRHLAVATERAVEVARLRRLGEDRISRAATSPSATASE